MGVIVKQKDKGKGKPWWVFICHQGKRKSVKVGDKAAAETVASKIREAIKDWRLLTWLQKRKLLRLASMPGSGLKDMGRPT